MNQVKIRLHIIKLAISITDNETIQVQIIKLLSLKKDNKPLKKILKLLQKKNYSEAQQLIISYIDSHDHSIDFSFLSKKKELQEPKRKEKVINSKIFQYTAMPHILEKYNTMKKQYPLHKQNYDAFHSINHLIETIHKVGYSEENIQIHIQKAQKLKEKNQMIEAGSLLLLCGLTQSKFAQLVLARELFSGIIFIKNEHEAFLLIRKLALDAYPQAIYDLAQFYENGICTQKDTKKAQIFYQEAMNLGILRAQIHYERLLKKNQGFFRLLGFKNFSIIFSLFPLLPLLSSYLSLQN